MATIRFGAGDGRLGIDPGNGDALRPLFFGIDATGNIHIPDFENRRIAVFKPSGTFVRAVHGVEGVTPRMNFFNVAPDGSYIAFSDGSLFRANAAGESLWHAPFPLGTIPAAILCSDEAVYTVVESSGTMECFAIPMTPPYTAYSSSLAGTSGPIAMIQAGGLPFTWRLADMPVVNPRFVPSPPESAATSTLVAAVGNGISVWQSEGLLGRQIYVLDGSGRLIQSIRLADSVKDEGSWHTIRVSEGKDSLIVAILSLTDEALVIKSIVISE